MVVGTGKVKGMFIVRLIALLAAAAILSPFAICRCTHAGPCAGEGVACAERGAAPQGGHSCCHQEEGEEVPAPTEGGCGCAKLSASSTPLVVEPFQVPLSPEWSAVVPFGPLASHPGGGIPAVSSFVSSFDTGPPGAVPLFVLNGSFLI